MIFSTSINRGSHKLLLFLLTNRRFVNINATLFPGDEFITHCVYDTADTTEVINGCEASSCEMCINYLAY